MDDKAILQKETEYIRQNQYFLEADRLTMHFPVKTDYLGHPTS